MRQNFTNSHSGGHPEDGNQRTDRDRKRPHDGIRRSPKDAPMIGPVLPSNNGPSGMPTGYTMMDSMGMGPQPMGGMLPPGGPNGPPDMSMHGPPDMGMHGGPNIAMRGPDMPIHGGPGIPMHGPDGMAIHGPDGMPQLGPGGMPFPGQFDQFMGGLVPMPPQIITHESCVLYPPNPNAPPPSTRERPPGCRTIFIGGLPENVIEDQIKEVFCVFGDICNLRLSKKNYAHLRYELEESADRSLFLSGYRMKLEDKDDKPNTGRLHIDYAQARDDLYEWECRQRALQREQRHRDRLEQALKRPASPLPVVHFSDHEANTLCEQLKGNDNFIESSDVLITWLARGDCNRRSASVFYSMIQIVNSHVRRLMSDKDHHDQELMELKEKFKERIQHIIAQFGQIEKVFNSSTKQKCWDHFTKPQRKNIELWNKQAKEILRMQQEDFLKQREEDEMELSDTEDTGQIKLYKKPKKEDLAEAAIAWAASNNKGVRNEDLKFELEAYKNEAELLKQEASSTQDFLNAKIKTLEKTMKGMQEQVLAANREKRNVNEQLVMIRQQKVHLQTRLNKAQQNQGQTKSASQDDTEEATTSSANDTEIETTTETSGAETPDGAGISERDAKIVGLVSTFLHVHPFGASLDYIWSYLHRIDITIRSHEIESLLEKLPSVFKQAVFGVGASMEKRWTFVGFENDEVVIA